MGGGKKWTISEQDDWLGARYLDFKATQGKRGKGAAFTASTTEAFNEVWPLPEPTAEEIAACKGDVAAAKSLLLQTRRNVSNTRARFPVNVTHVYTADQMVVL